MAYGKDVPLTIGICYGVELWLIAPNWAEAARGLWPDWERIGGKDALYLAVSQVVLSLQLPFALYPLIRFTSSRRLMGVLANSPGLALVGWLLFGVICLANGALLVALATG